MSEYWKSTPKYWCKHCSTYVRDTKLERTNHEATGKHQGAVKRSLRDLHRNAEQKERDKERARREVERLNGVVSGSFSSSGPSSSKSSAFSKVTAPPPPRQLTETERQKQLEQLADLGVSIPSELRGTMALPGEWTVTATKVISSAAEGQTQELGQEDEQGQGQDDEEIKDEARAIGVKRPRERTEEEKEQEEAIRGLFVKRKKWGVDSKRAPEEDLELDALLSGPLQVGKKKKEDDILGEVKEEDISGKVKKEEDVLEEVKGETYEGGGQDGTAVVKQEPEEDTGEGLGGTSAATPTAVKEEENAPAVVFKKRKPKNMRQK